MVAYVGRRRSGCLHFVPRCGRRPGIDFASYTHFGQERPAASAYERICKVGSCAPSSSSSFVDEYVIKYSAALWVLPVGL